MFIGALLFFFIQNLNLVAIKHTVRSTDFNYLSFKMFSVKSLTKIEENRAHSLFFYISIYTCKILFQGQSFQILPCQFLKAQPEELENQTYIHCGQ